MGRLGGHRDLPHRLYLHLQSKRDLLNRHRVPPPAYRKFPSVGFSNSKTSIIIVRQQGKRISPVSEWKSVPCPRDRSAAEHFQFIKFLGYIPYSIANHFILCHPAQLVTLHHLQSPAGFCPPCVGSWASGTGWREAITECYRRGWPPTTLSRVERETPQIAVLANFASCRLNWHT